MIDVDHLSPDDKYPRPRRRERLAEPFRKGFPECREQSRDVVAEPSVRSH